MGLDGPHLLDVVVVGRVDNGGDIEVGQAAPATEGDLAEHARGALGTLLNGVVVTNVAIREGDSGVLLAVDSDGVDLSVASARGEDDGAGDIVKGPESDSVGGNSGGGGGHGQESGSELHFEVVSFCEVG